MHYNCGLDNSVVLGYQFSLYSSIGLLPIKIQRIIFGRNGQADPKMSMETQRTFSELWKSQIVEDLI